jgi:Family of unknown function (DUF6271)
MKMKFFSKRKIAISETHLSTTRANLVFLNFSTGIIFILTDLHIPQRLLKSPSLIKSQLRIVMPGNTKLRLVYTPTNRDSTSVLLQRLEETRWAMNYADNRAIFCLIENSIDSQVSNSHRALLKELAKDIPVIHFQESDQEQFMVNLLKSKLLKKYDTQFLRSLLLPTGTSYGRGPNLAYLLAVALNAESVHRRDSDVYLDEERPKELPIELEIKAIDQNLGNVNIKNQKYLDGGYNAKSKIRIVGTSVYDSPPIDRRDLLSAGVKHLIAFQTLGRPGVPLEKVKEEAEEYLITEPKTKHSDDFYVLDTAGLVEMGSCCIAEIYKYLPEMPTYILGCDYMVNDLNWRLHNPSLFHSRKMHHLYDANRASHEANMYDSVDYSIRDIQYIQLGRIWREVGKVLDVSKLKVEKGHFDINEYASVWEDVIERSMGALSQVRQGAIKVYSNAAKDAKSEVKVRLESVHKAIIKADDNLDKGVINAITDFLYLA